MATAPTGLAFTIQAQEQATPEEGDALPASLCLCVPTQNLNLDLTGRNCVVFCCHPQWCLMVLVSPKCYQSSILWEEELTAVEASDETPHIWRDEAGEKRKGQAT